MSDSLAYDKSSSSHHMEAVSSRPLLSIIIVNYNGAQFIDTCLESIFESETSFGYEVIVVDNESKDDSLNVLRRYKDRIILKENKINTGFGYANNQGAKIASGEYLFLLNNDTKLEKNTMQLLVDFYKDKETSEKVGLISPKLLNEDGSLQCHGSSLGHGRFKKGVPVKVSFLAGAAVVISKKVFESVGGFDENFFFYNEDLDLCKTLLKKGYTLYYFPLAQLIHYGGLSTTFRRVGSLIEGYRGGIYIAEKHYPLGVSLLYRIVLLFDILIKLIFHGALFFRPKSREWVKGYLEIARITITNDIYLKRDAVE